MRRKRTAGAPQTSVRSLTPEQGRALAAHLKLKLPGPDAKRVLAAIEHWFDAGGFGANPDDQERHAEDHRHKRQIATLARGLQGALRREPPLWNTAGIDWRAVDDLLERISRSAEAESPTAETPVGPRRLKWREALIAMVHAHYPPDKVTVSCSSHFTMTIEMLLRFLGEDLEDLDRQIRRTLKRHPASPFVLHLHD